jgi:DNA helicase-2/ATP-dependent DNA helicase PcrA
MAVLVRARSDAEFETVSALGIPPRDRSAFTSARNHDALAFRVVAQGDDDLAFERIVNKPNAGSATRPTLHNHARRQPALLGGGGGAADELPPKARALSTSRNRLRAGNSNRCSSAQDLAEMVLDGIGLHRHAEPTSRRRRGAG